MRRGWIVWALGLLLASPLLAAPPGPDITVAQVPVTGDAHFGGLSHYHITFTFTDPDGVQNARYVDPDAGGTVNLGGGCISPFAPTVFHKSKVTEAHADDCGDPPSVSHYHFISPIFLNPDGVSVVEIEVPKRNATVTSVDATPAGVVVQTATAENAEGTGTIVTVTIANPTTQPARVRIGVDPHGEMFFYEIEQVLSVLEVPSLSVWGLVLLGLLVAGVGATVLRLR